jgi:aminopeptidase N
MQKVLFYWLLLNICLSLSLSGQPKELKSKFDVHFYFLDVEITDTNTFIKGTCSVGIHVLKPTDTLLFDMGSQLLVSKITLNNNQPKFLQKNNLLYVYGNSFSMNSSYLISISYSGEAGPSFDNPAMFNVKGLTGNVTYTLTEPFGAHNWFPCKEDLNDKADSVYVYVTIPQGYKVGSNGILKRITPVVGNKNRYEWESRYPTDFYLISLAMANYRDYTIYASIEGKNLPIVNYIYNDDAFFADNKEIIDTTVALIRTFSELFGTYPYIDEKYGHCIVPNIGGMEHQTMTTLGHFSFGLIAHELAHQWFGDEVTCSNWNDIWVNEGFASYSEYLAIEKLTGTDNAKKWLLATQENAMGSTDGSIYVPESEINSVNRIFDYRLTYKKGAAIIHMIRFELNNDELFFTVLQEFLKRYKFKSASAEDFRAVLEELSGRSFANFFKEWYYGEGYPIMDLTWTQKNDTLYILNKQETSAPGITDFFHLRIGCKLSLQAKDTIVRYLLNSSTELVKIRMQSTILNLIADPGKDILGTFRNIINTDTIDISSSSILIYPNPADTELTVFSDEVKNPVKITLFDINGRTIKILPKVYTQWSSVSVNDLSDGIYFIRLENDLVNQTTKFIKKKKI